MTKTGACLVNVKSFSMYTLTYAKTVIIQAFMMILSYIFERKDINTSMDFNRKKCRILQKNR